MFWQARKSLPDRQRKWHMLSLNRSPPTDWSKVFVLLTIPLSDSLAVNRRFHYYRMSLLYRNHLTSDSLCSSGQCNRRCNEYYSFLWSLSWSDSQCYSDPGGRPDASAKLCLFCTVYSGITAVWREFLRPQDSWWFHRTYGILGYFAITVFGGLFGILGMIVGVPIFAVIYAAIKAVSIPSFEKRICR